MVLSLYSSLYIVSRSHGTLLKVQIGVRKIQRNSDKPDARYSDMKCLTASPNVKLET